MKEKPCRNCNELKSLDSYYKHKQMFDGHLNICIECKKKDVKLYRIENIEKVKEYDRNRPNAEERNKRNCERVKNLSNDKKLNYKKVLNNFAMKEFSKNKKCVNTYLDNAVRDGRIIKPLSCERCPNTLNIQGHHPSYLNPLDVIWLCTKCHGKEHKRIREVERSNQT